MSPRQRYLSMQIRRAEERDVPQLLALMRGLASFENYINSFAVAENDLLEHGFRRTPPDFHCFVAHEDDSNELSGMIVYYFVHFTATTMPTLFIKELFVTEANRGKRTGRKLMRAVARVAIQTGCGTIRWCVAPWNRDGIRFYEGLGARADHDWLNFELPPRAVEQLAGS